MAETSMDLGEDMVDVLRLGEGAAQGGWGFALDGMRAMGLAAPATKIVAHRTGLSAAVGAVARKAKSSLGGGKQKLVTSADDVLEAETASALGGSQGPAGACFVAGSEVLTPEGWVPIEQVELGRSVVARELSEAEHTSVRDRSADRDVVARITGTFVRLAPAVIDAEVLYADGSVDTLTGTPNHPFWVGAVRDYVALGDLEIGTVLHVRHGGRAMLVSKTWRQGDFERGSPFRVFDIEVEGRHNFYVRGAGGGVAGVLVHNSSVPPGGSIRGVNPTGGRLNCGNCAVATDATLAGRPASALPGGLTSLDELAGAFGKSPSAFIPTKGVEGAIKIVDGWGAGSRGVVYGLRDDGTAHFFNVVNQKGTVRFLDGQTGGVAKTDDFVRTIILRTDNVGTTP